VEDLVLKFQVRGLLTFWQVFLATLSYLVKCFCCSAALHALVPLQGSTKQQQILHWNRLVHYSITQIIVAIAISEKMMGTD